MKTTREGSAPATGEGSGPTSDLPIADRVRNLGDGGFRGLFDVARRLPGAVDLSIGQPCSGMTTSVRAAAADALARDTGRYSPTEGYPEFLEALRHHLRTKFAVDGGDVIATCGITGGLNLACQVLFQAGDEVLVPDPGFIVHSTLVELTGARAVRYDTYPDFHLRRAALEAVATPATRAVLVCNPGNPTGAAASGDELQEVARFARERGIWILTDEAYAELVYDRSHVSLKRFTPDALLFGGFSKSHGIAGWRLGYVHGPKEIIERIRLLQQYAATCAPTLPQRAMTRALADGNDEIRTALKARRDLVVHAMAGLLETPPDAGLFAFFPAPWGSGSTFVARCLEKGLVIVPGASFSRRDTHCRLSFSADLPVLQKGLDILRDVAREGAPR